MTTADAVLGDLALLAQSIVDDDSLVEGNRIDLAERLAVAEQIASTLSGIAARLTDELGDLMESNDEQVGPWHVRRSVKWTRTRSQEDARNDGRAVIVRRLALDRATGELNPAVAATVQEAIDHVFRCYSVNLTYGGMKALGLDVDEYETKARAGWKIDLIRDGGAE